MQHEDFYAVDCFNDILGILRKSPEAQRILGEMQRVPTLLNHSLRTALRVVHMGNKIMGLKDDDLMPLALGALFHDVGKIFWPREIVEKPTSLTPQEDLWRIRHPFDGAMLVRLSLDLSPTVQYIILQHHERRDGSGYPKGLSGDAIHPFAQLTSLVEMYDAMLEDRPYRKAYTPEAAAELICGMGDRFDSTLLKLFLTEISDHAGPSLERVPVFVQKAKETVLAV